MENATLRDRFAAENDILCFETEAAGLMNHFPCLVVRGICDYSDSHKNQEWQGYAAMTAAAYAKALLDRVHPNRVEIEKKLGDILSEGLAGLQEATESHRDIAQKQLEIQENVAKELWSDKEAACLQLFRLADSTKDATYEWYKDRVDDRVEDTCLWFLEHEHFRMWLERESGPLLVSADPGCGKSVLAKFLIDHELQSSATVCYFFFKDQDQNTVRQALCALLHQLFSQKPSLIEHAMKQFAKDGRNLINSTRSLWAVLENAVQDARAGSIILVLDALDECIDLELENLIRRVENQFRNDPPSCGKLRYLLTSRPYEQVVTKFRDLLEAFPYIRIPGEEESESISREVNRVIQYRTEQLAKEKGLTKATKDHLAKRLLEIPHRTYLWVYLIFDYLETEPFNRTPGGVDSTIATLPKNVNQVYEHIFHKSKEHPLVRKALSIILAASRPFTVAEMDSALQIDETVENIRDLHFEKEQEFKLRLRSWCGLLISIHHGKIYFLHQTVREFLLAGLASGPDSPTMNWHQSIKMRDAHTVLAHICVFSIRLCRYQSLIPSSSAQIWSLLDYSAKNWGFHFREARISNDSPIIPDAVWLCRAGSLENLAWFDTYWTTTGIKTPDYFYDLFIPAFFGHEGLAQWYLSSGTLADMKDGDNRTPLSWAAENGHAAVVQQLIDHGAAVNAKDKKSWTALAWAAENGHEAVAQTLLSNGADANVKDKWNRTALSWAARNGRDAYVRRLLDHGAEIDAKDNEGRTPLSWAARNGDEAVVQRLLDYGAAVDAPSNGKRTPLSYAARHGYEAVVRRLLDKGADANAKDNSGHTPLAYAKQYQHEAIQQLLISHGAEG